jgi:hypothetical protein
MKLGLIVLWVFALVGCAVPTKVVQLKNSFDEVETAKLLQRGPNTIKGSALLRQQGGGVVTCAGLPVRLVPVTAYSAERMVHIYGNLYGGFASLEASKRAFEPSSAAYLQNTKETVCDPQGFFKFNDVANGDFYLVTVISWKVREYSLEGGALAKRISVFGGETKEIVLTDR